LADILFGKISPSGHLPVTFYNSFDDLPDYADYSMKGRTYRYFNGKTQFPFGFGMSYTSFDYAWIKQPSVSKDSVMFSIKLKNTGKYNGDEVAQVYIHYPSIPGMPVKELKAFKRITLTVNEESNALFAIPLNELQKWDLQKHEWKKNAGMYKIVIGSNAADERLSATIKLN
jgi:beta-glucosidase